MTKKVCFVANFTKTYFFHELASKLEEYGIEIFWVVVRKQLYKFLIEYYSADRILYINKSYTSKESKPVADFKLNELLFGDRILKYDYREGQNFLVNIQSSICAFLKNNQISVVFGEVTWAHELLISRICRKYLDIDYLSFQSIRIPNGRLCFFKDEEQVELLELSLFKKNNDQYIESSISSNFDDIQKPEYLKRNDFLLAEKYSFRGHLKRIHRMLTNENIDKLDPCNISKGWKRYEIPFNEEWNRLSYATLKKKKYEEIKGLKYIFFGFHKQPEASVDVCGRYYENQSLNVINLWRQLPNDWYLVIKEHSNAIGDRGALFFKRLLKYPRILLVDENIDSHLLIKNAQLVATNTGTMALEAALMGKPAFTFSPVFFNKINRCPNIGIDFLRKFGSIKEVLGYINNLSDNRAEYLEYIENNSFEGENADPQFNPKGMTKENICKVASAILMVIEKDENSKKNFIS